MVYLVAHAHYVFHASTKYELSLLFAVADFSMGKGSAISSGRNQWPMSTLCRIEIRMIRLRRTYTQVSGFFLLNFSLNRWCIDCLWICEGHILHTSFSFIHVNPRNRMTHFHATKRFTWIRTPLSAYRYGRSYVRIVSRNLRKQASYLLTH